ncbi:MAG TPA: hypothetical protein VG204_08775 [Terriglobia bacterium]|nr:hypothetical protein [Terriglobia bacterium]
MISANGNVESVLKRMEDFERRVQELRNEAHEAETREWRFWGRWGPLIYMAMGAMLAIALGFPNAVKSLGEGEATSSLEPQEYVLRDGGGRIRAKLVISDDIPQLTLYDTKGYASTATPFEHKLSVDRPDAPETPSVAPGTRIHNSDYANPSKQLAETPRDNAAPAPSSLTRLTRLIRETFSPGAVPSDASHASAIPIPLPARRSIQKFRPTPQRVAVLALPGLKPAAVQPVLADLFRPGSVPHLEALPLMSPASRTLADSPSVSAPASPTPVAPLVLPPSPALSTNAAPALPVPTPTGAASLTALPVSPSVKLTVLGYVEKPGVGREVLVSQNSEVYVTHEGETFADRFKVLRITPTVVEVLDTYTHQTLQLSVSP